MYVQKNQYLEHEYFSFLHISHNKGKCLLYCLPKCLNFNLSNFLGTFFRQHFLHSYVIDFQIKSSVTYCQQKALSHLFPHLHLNFPNRLLSGLFRYRIFSCFYFADFTLFYLFLLRFNLRLFLFERNTYTQSSNNKILPPIIT